MFNDQDSEFDKNNITNLDSVTVNKNPISDKELVKKNEVDDSDKNNVPRFYKTFQNYLKVSVGNETYNLTKYDKIQPTDMTEVKFPNIGSDFLPKWNIKCVIKKNNDSKVGNFIKSTIMNSPTSYSRATSLPPFGNSLTYIETSSNNHGHERVFVRFERTDINPIRNITFFYNRFSVLTNDLKKLMGTFIIQLILEDNTWSTRYIIPKKDGYNISSTQSIKLRLKFSVENFGIKLIYDQIDTPHADVFLRNIE